MPDSVASPNIPPNGGKRKSGRVRATKACDMCSKLVGFCEFQVEVSIQRAAPYQDKAQTNYFEFRGKSAAESSPVPLVLVGIGNAPIPERLPEEVLQNLILCWLQKDCSRNSFYLELACKILLWDLGLLLQV